MIIIINVPIVGGYFYSLKKKNKSGYFFCSQKCSKEYMRGDKSPFWRGGTIFSNGYKVIKVNGIYKYKHRIIMENYLNRKLKNNEIVRHIDGNKLNNSIDNLKVMEKKEHDRKHTIERHKKQRRF